jgi:hypothetical protein
MSDPSKDFYSKLVELYDLYEKVKGAVILAENIHERRKVSIAPLNQLRSALDHIFKAAKQPNDFDYELKEA